VVKDMHGFNKGAPHRARRRHRADLVGLHPDHVRVALRARLLRRSLPRPAAGLQFPDDEEPDYGDFFYFSSVIGTSGPDRDVSFVTKPLRRNRYLALHPLLPVQHDRAGTLGSTSALACF